MDLKTELQNILDSVVNDSKLQGMWQVEAITKTHAIITQTHVIKNRIVWCRVPYFISENGKLEVFFQDTESIQAARLDDDNSFSNLNLN